jgi:hypothetical protein
MAGDASDATRAGEPQLVPFDVFLASPGDVVHERDLADQVVAQVNETVGRRLNVAVRLTKWEMQPSGGGRPQARINPRVRTCHLFVGLIWQRWGTATGEFTSGFEEEFAIARARYDSGEPAEIALYVRQPTGDQQADPGPQMRQVNKFLKKVRAEQVLLYDNYVDAQAFGYKFYDLLVGQLLDRTGAQAGAGAAGAGVTSDEELTVDKGAIVAVSAVDIAQTTETVTVTKSDESASEEPERKPPQPASAPRDRQPEPGVAASGAAAIADALERVGRLLVTGQHTEPGDLDRMQMFAAATRSLSAGDLVAPDLAVRIYQQWREGRVELVQLEAAALRRAATAGVVPGGPAVPGWFASTGASLVEQVDILAQLAVTDGDVVVRRGALGLLRAARLRPAAWWDTAGDAVTPGLAALTAANVAKDGLEYLRAVAEPGDATVLAGLADLVGEHGRTYDERKLRALVAAMAEDYVAIREALRDPEIASMIPDKSRDGAVAGADAATKADLIRQPGSSALAALNALADAGELSADHLYEAATNDDDGVRRRVVELVQTDAARDVDGPRVAEVLTKSRFGPSDLSLGALVLAHTVAEPELRRRTLKIGDLGPESYAALCLVRPEELHLVRDDLRAGMKPQFERVVAEMVAGEEDDGDRVEAFVREKLDGLRDYLIGRWTLAALVALASSPEPEDVPLLVSFLSQGDIWEQEAAAEALDRNEGAIGAVEELAILASRRHDPALMQLVGRAAAGTDSMSEQLLRDESDQVAFAVLDELRRRGELTRSVMDVLNDWLSSKSSTRRLRAADELTRNVDKSQRATLLDQYLAGSYYYYDVVGLLDRAAFAPDPFSEVGRP